MIRLKQIQTLDDPAAELLVRTSEIGLYRHNEPLPGYFVAESPNVILRGLEAGYEPVSVLTIERKNLAAGEETGSPAAGENAEDLTAEGNTDDPAAFREKSGGEFCDTLKMLDLLQALPSEIPVYEAPLSVMQGMTGYPMTRGSVCLMRRKKLPEAETVLADATRVAVLENVVNPTNIGAIFRSAAAMDLDAVLLSPGCCDPLYRRSLRVSMGTVFQIPWTFIGKHPPEWPADGVPMLKKLGFSLAAMALSEDSISIADPLLKKEPRLALLLGSEGPGLQEETIRNCDHVVRIPMKNGVDSLNVAAAAAVAFWEIRKE